MNIEEYIRKQITEHLNPSHLEVINESHLHVGHAGDDGSDQTHFKVVVVSDKFNGMQTVQRHRLVNDLLSDCFKSGLHALSLKLTQN
jgi:BolA protein